MRIPVGFTEWPAERESSLESTFNDRLLSIVLPTLSYFSCKAVVRKTLVADARLVIANAHYQLNTVFCCGDFVAQMQPLKIEIQSKQLTIHVS